MDKEAIKEFFGKLLCKIGIHDICICYDHDGHTISKVCLRLDCDYDKEMLNNRSAVKKFRASIARKHGL